MPNLAQQLNIGTPPKDLTYDPQQLLRNEIDQFGYKNGDAFNVASGAINDVTQKRVQDLLSRYSTSGLSRSGIQGAALNNVYANTDKALGSAAVQSKESMANRRARIIAMLLQNQQYEDSQPSAFGQIAGSLISGGAQVGSAALLASDKRLKENIEYTGKKTKDGVPVITYNYKGNPQKFEGVIAQDVEKVKPEAVYKAVDYAQL